MDELTTKVVTVAIPALVSGIVYLFFFFRAQYAKQEKQNAEKDIEIKRLNARINDLERKVGWLRVCPIQRCPYAKMKEILEDEDDQRDHGPHTNLARTVLAAIPMRLSPQDPEAQPT